jgi:hypothetical protein
MDKASKTIQTRITVIVPLITAVCFFGTIVSAHANWNFELADESRITIQVQNLEHRERFEIFFLPPIAGKPLDVSQTEEGQKQATFQLRGRISPRVTRFWFNDQSMVTSTDFFSYPILFDNAEETHFVARILRDDGRELSYRVIVHFLPPTSIYSEFEQNYQDVLQTVFNFQLSVSAMNISTATLTSQNVLVFPMIGGRMFIEPKFLKYFYLSGWIYSSVLKDPSTNTNDVMMSLFHGQASARLPLDVGDGFILTPEVSAVIHSHNIVQNTSVLRVGITTYSAFGVRAGFQIEPNPNVYILPTFTYYLPATSRQRPVNSFNVGANMGFRVSQFYQLGFEYNLQVFNVGGAQKFSERFHHFLLHLGTYF